MHVALPNKNTGKFPFFPFCCYWINATEANVAKDLILFLFQNKLKLNSEPSSKTKSNRSPPDTACQMFLLSGFKRKIFNCENTKQQRMPGVAKANWEENQDFYVHVFFIRLHCVLLFLGVCVSSGPAGGFIILCTGATLWSPAVTKMLCCHWTEELWRQNFKLMNLYICTRWWMCWSWLYQQSYFRSDWIIYVFFFCLF